MDEEQGGHAHRRLRVAGIVTAAVLAVPGGMVISNAFAADGGGAAGSSTSPVQQTVPYGGSETPAPQDGGDGDRGDGPGKGDRGGSRGDSGAGPGSPSTESTGTTMQ